MAAEEVAGVARNFVCAVIFVQSSFIGRSLVRMLLESSIGWTVRIADSVPSLEMEDKIIVDSVESGRLLYFHVDIRDRAMVSRAIRGSSVVFVLDVLDSSLKSFSDHYRFVVQGVKNIISACHDLKVERLIYNSTADVIFDGVHDIYQGNESLPYPCRFEDVFCDLKVQAEVLVLSANSINGLSTCILRPCNPFGPGDPYFLPLLVDATKSFWSQFLVGVSTNLCDYTYVENVAHAHICTESALRCGETSVAGEVFFITNLQPVKSGDFASLMLGDLGFPCFRTSFHFPLRLVQSMLTSLVGFSEKLQFSPKRMAFLRTLVCTRTFDCSKAQKHIGYFPIVSLEDGIARTAESSPHLVNDSLMLEDLDLNNISKAESLLGSGKVADILLWRDEKKSFSWVVGLFMLFYWFLLSGRTLVTSAAELLFLALVILFGYFHLPSSLLGSRSEKISPSYFQVSEASIRAAVSVISATWNEGVHMIEFIVRSGDLSLLLKTTGGLYLFRLMLWLSPPLLIGTGLVGLFTVFIVYEQHEGQVDELMRKAIEGAVKKQGLARC
ncbi:3beta-hydroxysteroid-dehydrogenase/decarboxylase-like isoform X2 [Wolffia australiana]